MRIGVQPESPRAFSSFSASSFLRTARIDTAGSPHARRIAAIVLDSTVSKASSICLCDLLEITYHFINRQQLRMKPPTIWRNQPFSISSHDVLLAELDLSTQGQSGVAGLDHQPQLAICIFFAALLSVGPVKAN